MQRLFNRIQVGLDVNPLLTALRARPHLWDQITDRQDHPTSPHRETKTIFLRWAKDISIETVFTDLEAIDYPAMSDLKEARELVGTICREISAVKLGRVIITSLKAGGQISPHPDEGAYSDAYERFHLSIHSEPHSVFSCQWSEDHREGAFMKPGELWTFHHKKTHAVYNDSGTERIHLIVDAVAPKYRRERSEV
jgi:hypothetical protein